MDLSPEQALKYLVGITESLVATGHYTFKEEGQEGDGLVQPDPEVASPLVTDAAERILDFLIFRAERISEEQSRVCEECQKGGKN